MSSYDKLKNDELKKLLTERGLLTTGKKADFVARLIESDANKNEAKAPEAPSDQKAAPAQTEDSSPIKQKTPVPSIDADREAKLAARAARFGLPKDEEEQKKAARAAKFGTALPEDKALSQSKAKPDKKTPDTKTPAASKPQEKRKVSVLDDPIEAEKARKRALKFGTAQVSTPALEESSKPPAAEVATT